MRIGEALSLVPENIEFGDPTRINIQASFTKTKNSRIAFISKEASEAVEEWLKVRKDYLGSAVARSRFGKSIDDPRIFPFTSFNARYIWNIALKKTGNGKKDTQTNYHLVHPHVLRKFFRTRMATIIPVDVTEALMGHEGYLTEVYRRYTPEDLAKFYKQGELSISIFGGVVDLQQIQKQVDEKVDDKIGALQKVIDRYATENLESKSRLSSIELEITQLSEIFKEFKKKALKIFQLSYFPVSKLRLSDPKRPLFYLIALR